jgi:argininosuccinate lyase
VTAVGTGRLSSTLGSRAARIVFGDNADAGIDAELPYVTAIDQAHVVMLAERGLIRTDRAAALLTEIQSLRDNGFAPIRGRAAPRGVYLLYEGYLIDRLGGEVGGVLHTGRSRNDLKATMHQLRMREVTAATLGGLLRLQAVLLGRARCYRSTVMPAYSQFQPSTPVTYGYYLLGVAEALDRDADGLVQAGHGLRQCPLGAAGGAGTDVHIDVRRTAALLGFTEPVGHAGYAIASRDTLVRVLSAAALASLTLSRLGTDLQLWSMPEFDLIEFPDDLVGSSSAMPQKRNPFLLEHIKGGAGMLIGAWTAAMSTMKNAPFGNSVEVSTEGVAPVWAGLDRLQDMVHLAISVVAGARPRPDRMARGAHRGFTVAMAVANRLVSQGVPFRTAHTAIGGLITELIAEGAKSLVDVPAETIGDRLTVRLDTQIEITDADLDPAAVAAATEFGGGPGTASFAEAHARLAGRWRAQVRDLSAAANERRLADARREVAVHAILVAATANGGYWA